MPGSILPVLCSHKIVPSVFLSSSSPFWFPLIIYFLSPVIAPLTESYPFQSTLPLISRKASSLLVPPTTNEAFGSISAHRNPPSASYAHTSFPFLPSRCRNPRCPPAAENSLPGVAAMKPYDHEW